MVQYNAIDGIIVKWLSYYICCQTVNERAFCFTETNVTAIRTKEMIRHKLTVPIYTSAVSVRRGLLV